MAGTVKPTRPVASRRGRIPDISVTPKSDATTEGFNRIMATLHYELLVFNTRGFVDLGNRRLVRRQLVDALSKSNRVVDWQLNLPWEIRSNWNIGRLVDGCKAYAAGLDDALSNLSEVQELSVDDYASNYPDLAAAFARPADLIRHATRLIKRLKADASRRSGHAAALAVNLEYSEDSQSATALLDLSSAVLKIVHLGLRA